MVVLRSRLEVQRGRTTATVAKSNKAPRQFCLRVLGKLQQCQPLALSKGVDGRPSEPDLPDEGRSLREVGFSGRSLSAQLESD